MTTPACTDLLRKLEPEFRWNIEWPAIHVMDAAIVMDEIMRGVGIPRSALAGGSHYSSSRVALEAFNKRLVGVRGLQK